MAGPLAVVEVLVNILKFAFLYVVGCILWLRPTWSKVRKSVKNEVILVTGAGSGLGRGLALRLAAKGAKLVLWDLHKEQLDQTQKLIQTGGGKAWSFVCDVSDRTAVRETATKVRNQIGPVNILINNAGVLFGKLFRELEDDAIAKTLEVNTLAHCWTCKAFLPDMMASNKGHVVCISSMAGFLGSPKLTDYCTSKHAVVGFMESLREELRFDGYTGIKFSLICPYFFASGFYRGLGRGLVNEMSLDEVADAAVQAILTEQALCMIPWWLEIHVRVLSLTPAIAKELLGKVLGLDNMIKDFTGARYVSTKKSG